MQIFLNESHIHKATIGKFVLEQESTTISKHHGLIHKVRVARNHSYCSARSETIVSSLQGPPEPKFCHWFAYFRPQQAHSPLLVQITCQQILLDMMNSLNGHWTTNDDDAASNEVGPNWSISRHGTTRIPISTSFVFTFATTALPVCQK